MPLYKVTLVRHSRDYATVEVRADSEKAASRRAHKLLNDPDVEIDWCDGDGGDIKAHRITMLKETD